MRGVSSGSRRYAQHTFASVCTSPDALVASKAKPRGSSAVVNNYRDWARDRLLLIGTKLGNRLKNSVLRMYLLPW